MKCPKCGKENDDNWILEVRKDVFSDGGCQLCWEAECSESWWEMVCAIEEQALQDKVV